MSYSANLDIVSHKEIEVGEKGQIDLLSKEEREERLEPTTFIASFPPIQSAIKITGGGDGMRIQLDISETEMPKAMKLLLWRQMPLKITVEPQERLKYRPFSAGG